MKENKIYWKGLDELNNSPEFEKARYNEFAEKLPTSKVVSAEELDLKSNRRDFLKFMGFGITAATLAACARQPIKNAIPYVVKPQNADPGIPDFYATTCGGCGAGCSILVKTRDGRPIKIEGNAQSTFNKGGVCAAGQATVLSLYDLGRLSSPLIKGKEVTWEVLDNAVKNALSKGGNIRFLTGTINSPTLLAAIEKLKSKYSGLKHIQYDASSASAILAAHEKGFGKRALPSFKIDKAKVLVSFGADFLGSWISPVEFTKQYTEARNVDDKKSMLQHFQFEGNLSLSGSNADYRATISPSQVGAALATLYNNIATMAGVSTVTSPKIELAGNTLALAAKSLWAAKGESLVICDSNNVDHQTIVAGINHLLENYGPVLCIDTKSNQRKGNDKEMIELVAEMNSGSVQTLIMYKTNPVYSYPKGFGDALKKVANSISFTGRLDETASLCTMNAPDHHFLESWGDEMPKENYLTVYQPTISPIFNTRSAVESILNWSEVYTTTEAYMQNVWKAQYGNNPMGKSFDEFWIDTLELGFIQLNEVSPSSASFTGDVSSAASNTAKESNGGTKENPEIVIYEKVAIRNGTHSNNPWLQEMPDPITKISWDNYAAISPKMAEEWNVSNEDVIDIKGANGYSVKLPVLTLPGVKYGTVAIAAGYGRGANMLESNLKVAFNLGKNAYPFSTITNDSIEFGGVKATISKTGEKYELALSQTHHHMEGRDLVRETTVAEYVSGKYEEKVKEINHEGNHQTTLSLWNDYRFPGQRWGMAIDLNSCTGCGACVVSCIAENNTPVVGKDEVRRSREMHWMRIDRYFSLGVKDKSYKHHAHDVVIEDRHSNEFKEIDALNSKGNIDYEDVRVVFQPLMCQHCENAPCESVCPVNAISHSSDGLNMQAYNRCVGTRYCANNCPFKVRRFNWFNYALNDKFKDYTMQNDLGRMVLNPDVTVRTRGVMEKCTMCVQRIQTGKLVAKKEGRVIKDGEIQTACSQSCPANAIVFGDMNDPNSKLSKMLKNQRRYRLLNEINVRPVVNYMSKVRNLTPQNA